MKHVVRISAKTWFKVVGIALILSACHIEQYMPEEAKFTEGTQKEVEQILVSHQIDAPSWGISPVITVNSSSDSDTTGKEQFIRFTLENAKGLPASEEALKTLSIEIAKVLYTHLENRSAFTAIKIHFSNKDDYIIASSSSSQQLSFTMDELQNLTGMPDLQ